MTELEILPTIDTQLWIELKKRTITRLIELTASLSLSYYRGSMTS